MDPLTALAVQAGSQAVGAGLGKLLGRMNRVDPNEAYNDAPQYQEYSPMLQQSAIERARIGGRVDNRRESILARILSQANSAAPMSANSSRNVAAANAQNANMMNTIAGVEQNLDGYESQLEGRADDMQMQGRSRLAEIMQMNSMARQQAAQQARLANRQQSAAGMATGLGIGQQLGSGVVQYSMFQDQLNQDKERFGALDEWVKSFGMNRPDSSSLETNTMPMFGDIDAYMDGFNAMGGINMLGNDGVGRFSPGFENNMNSFSF